MGAPDGKPDEAAFAATVVEQTATKDASLPPQPSEHPRTIGRFDVVSKLGEGGMGVVVLATDPTLGRRVALKLLRREDSQTARDRFLREAQAMAQLSHENVIVVHEVGVHESRVFLAMEYVAGTTLRRWQANRGWREILQAYVRAGRGLQAAHAAGLVHRDFKPDNVLVGDDKVRVTDFGLVATSGGSDLTKTAESMREMTALGMTLTETGAVMGTPRYMAPEQHRGAEVDARADQFSFCVALFEALFGKPPFAGTTVAQLAASTQSGTVEPIPTTTEVPVIVRDAVLRGLKTDRDARFPSMGELLNALHVPERRRRRRWVFAVVGVGVLALGAIVWWSRMDAERARERADELDRTVLVLKNTPEYIDAKSRFEHASEAYLQGRYEEAALSFMEAYAAKSAPQFLYNTGAAYHMLGKKRKTDATPYRLAITMYQRYLEADPAATDREQVQKSMRVLASEVARLEGSGSGSGGGSVRQP